MAEIKEIEKVVAYKVGEKTYDNEADAKKAALIDFVESLKNDVFS